MALRVLISTDRTFYEPSQWVNVKVRPPILNVLTRAAGEYFS